MLIPHRKLSDRRPSASALIAKTSRPLTRRPWLAVLVLFAFWCVWVIVDRFSGFTEPGIATEIKALHEKAKAEFTAMRLRQSPTLEAAKVEYTRRYKLDPPPGYDKWYEYAVSSGSRLIDEYDDLMKDLNPYLHFYGSNCDMQANKVVSNDIVRICIENHEVNIDGWNITNVMHLIDTINLFAPHLPDLCITANTLEQPRTVLGRAMLSSIFGPNPPDTCEIQHFSDMSRLNIWNDATQSCPPHSNAKNVLRRSTQEGPPSLVHSWKEATDLCSRTHAPRSGIITNPETMRLSSVVRPILSAGKLSTFHDIMYPGVNHVHGAEEPTLDYAAWTDKRSALGWRGDTSGGWVTPLNYREFQRQTMVHMANTRPELAWAGRAAAHPRDLRPDRESRALTRVQHEPSYKDLLDFGFTDFTSCDPSGCDMMRKELGSKRITAANEPLDCKLVLAMDGSGADPDLYRKLKSNSAVVRQGLVREWHDDRLVPWLHYIPLSLDGGELPGLVEYLLGKGEGIAKAIGDEGRKWAMQALRKEDLDVYTFRLLLEMGRRTY